MANQTQYNSSIRLSHGSSTVPSQQDSPLRRDQIHGGFPCNPAPWATLHGYVAMDINGYHGIPMVSITLCPLNLCICKYVYL